MRDEKKICLRLYRSFTGASGCGGSGDGKFFSVRHRENVESGETGLVRRLRSLE